MCTGQCTYEGSGARCRADGLKKRMVEFQCKLNKEQGAKKSMITMPIAVTESCSCSVGYVRVN